MSPFQWKYRVLVCLLLMLSVGPVGRGGSANAQLDAKAPVLSSAFESAAEADTIVVTGHGFTEGGSVYIALYDQWGERPYDTRWVTASRLVYQPASSAEFDAGFSFDTGGNIRETFELTAEPLAYAPNETINGVSVIMPEVSCDTLLMVRAFDRGTATWSNLLDVDLDCAD